jgi:hypothetical protein
VLAAIEYISRMHVQFLEADIMIRGVNNDVDFIGRTVSAEVGKLAWLIVV